ncbi:PHP domain-containing protein [Leucobacter tardus]|uniref:PHP domain-containing protein n=1 Tax=Leucobacter tardus TaxID=501483 RepID=A0A939QMH1_9MICO|nr:PHP domain-containing protein [Leucobacter tardus]MBO2990414.1 PHP domain-containing protein [Leucobacter tardus]
MASSLSGYDLHTHSIHSDGTTTPGEIVREAAALGLAGIALTDHDTVTGWPEARAAAAEAGIAFLPGVEITTRYGHRSTHLLAYGVDVSRGRLADELRAVREARHSRAREMVARLAADYDIAWETVVAEGDDRTVGRPHIADALVTAGYYADRSTVFAEILHPRSPYYVPTYATDTAEAIELVRDAGGVAVLAHPAAARQSGPVTDAALEDLADAGLWGVELEHPENRDDWLTGLRAIVRRRGLVVTGASDFHGAGKPNRLGERTTDAATVARIRECVAIPE